MTESSRAIVVGVNNDRDNETVRWAAGYAARCGVPLHIVLSGRDNQADSRTVLAHSFATAHDAGANVVVNTARTAEQPLRVSIRSAADAVLLVVSAPTPEVDELIVRSFCPVIVVPTGIGPAPADDAPVVLAMGPSTGPEVADFAFAEAAAGGARLQAVRTWSDPLVELGNLRSDLIARWDAAEARSRDDLRDQLSAWTAIHPQVRLESLVIDDRCADLLLALGMRARLLVVGRPSRGELVNETSPAAILARHAPCPVVIVPTPGTTRPAWLPTRQVGLTDLRA